MVENAELSIGDYLTDNRGLYCFCGYGPAKKRSLFLEDCKTEELVELTMRTFAALNMRRVRVDGDA